MIELDQYIINTNILSKFEEDWVNIVATRVVTRKLLTTDDDEWQTTDIQVSQKLTLSIAQVS